MVNCAISFIKYIIFAFNFLFFLIGVSLFGGGIYVIAAHYPTEIHAGDVILYAPAVPYVVAVVGFIISVIAFLGCCGAIMQSTCMLMSFSVVMLALLVTQLGFGIYALVNHDVLIEKGLFATLNATKGNDKLLNAWEGIQFEHKCCGVNKPTDWEPILGYIPITCCPMFWADESDDGSWISNNGLCTVEDATKTGCKEKLVDFVRQNLYAWMALGFSLIIVVQFVGILFTCIMFCAFRKRDRELHAAHHSLRYPRMNFQEVIRPTAPKEY